MSLVSDRLVQWRFSQCILIAKMQKNILKPTNFGFPYLGPYLGPYVPFVWPNHRVLFCKGFTRAHMPGMPHAQLNGGLTKRQRIDKAATDSKRSKALIGLVGHGPMKRKALWVPLWALWALGSLKGAPLCVGAKSVMGISVCRR